MIQTNTWVDYEFRTSVGSPWTFRKKLPAPSEVKSMLCQMSPRSVRQKTPGGKTISLKSAALTVTQKQHKNKVPDKSSKKSSQGKESSMTWKNIIDDENWQKTVAQNEKTWRVFLKKNSSFYLLMQVKLFLEKKEELCVIWWPESFISWNIRKILLKNM